MAYFSEMTTIKDHRIIDTTPKTASSESVPPCTVAFADSLRA
jgi:hypothetical protein